MSTDKPNGSLSKGRRFGRGLFSSTPKNDPPTPTWMKPPTNSLVPEVQAQSRPISPAPQQTRPASPIKGKITKPASSTPIDPKLSRRQSKSNSLFDLFSKPKVERARGFHEGGVKGLEPVQERPTISAPIQNSPKKHQLQDQQRPIQKAQSTAALRTESRLSILPQKHTPNLQPAISSPNSIKPNDNWDPPPLFQAYPQAIKHSKLFSVSSSTESLLRSQQSKRQHGSEGYSGSPTLGFVAEGQEEIATDHKLRRISVLSETPDLVEKIFVLVTAGRLVQYSTTGHSDRAPEKVLQLGPKSAAFACDLIPGKHWVVQVAQNGTEINQPTIKPSRSILSRLRVSGAIGMARKSVNTMLLVFNSAEEMTSWIQAIRTIIEQLGGNKRNTEPEIRKPHQQEQQRQKPVSELPSHRFLVQRDPNMFNETRRDSVSPVIPPQKTASPASSEGNGTSNIPSAVTLSTGDSPAITPITPVERDGSISTVRSRRISSTTTSASTTSSFNPDVLRLEPLKETSRFSSTSTRTSRTSDGDMTAATSLCSSSPPSPGKSISPESDSPRMFGPRAVSSTPNLNINSRRRSAQPDPSAPAVPALPPSARMSMQTMPNNNTRGLRPLRVMSQEFNSAPRFHQDTRQFSAPRPMMTSSPIPESISPRVSINFSTPRNMNVIRTADQNHSRSNIGQSSDYQTQPRQSRVLSEPAIPPRIRPFFRPFPVKPSTGGPMQLSTQSRSTSVPQVRTAGSKPRPFPIAIPGKSITESRKLPIAITQKQTVSLAEERFVPSIAERLGEAEKKQTRITVTELAPLNTQITSIASTVENQESASPQDELLAEAEEEFIPELRSIPIPPRNRGDPQHYAQAQTTAPSSRRLSSVPLANPPALPLPDPPTAILPSLATRPSSRSAFVPPPVTAIKTGRRTPSISSGFIISTPSTRSSSPAGGHSRQSSVAMTNTSQTTPPSQPASKLKRPTSLQIRTDHAPFLSSRRGGSVTQRPGRASSTSSARSNPLFSGPYASRVLSTLQPATGQASETLTELKEPPELEINSKRWSTLRALSKPVEDKQTTSSVALSSKNLKPSVSPSPRAPSPGNHSRSSSISRTRSVSPTNSDISDSAILETVSTVRMSVYTPASLITTDIPRSPASSTFFFGASPPNSPPPIPPMNPNRAAMRSKVSVQNISTIAKLPPPMPPPNCPLPEVPSVV